MGPGRAVTAHETCLHGGTLYYRDRCPHPAAHGPQPGARPAAAPVPDGVRRHLDARRLPEPGTLEGDRALAMRALWPRRGHAHPPWRTLTDSQRAEVTRVVEAFVLVRQAHDRPPR